VVLTPANLVHYLIDCGLITRESVIDGDFLVAEVIRRNRSFKVIRRKQPGYFVKQVRKWDAMSTATLNREGYCYKLTNQDGDFRALAALMPKFYHFDANRSILVTELLDGAENLSEYHLRQRDFPKDIGKHLGEAFGRYHKGVRTKHFNGSMSSVLPRATPWILSVHQSQLRLFNNISGGNHQLVALVEKYPDFSKLLDALRVEWQATALIHGDIKWDNCLLDANAGSNSEAALKIIDWELADWGDPCWDVAAVFTQYLVYWIQSMPFQSGADTGTLVERAAYPLERMQPAIKEFWAAYARAMEMSRKEESVLLRRVTRYCGARMIQTAYEYLQYSQQVNALTLYLLQASFNILTQPDDAIDELFDIAGPWNRN
jgi:thiamine kinase-like enzyme